MQQDEIHAKIAEIDDILSIENKPIIARIPEVEKLLCPDINELTNSSTLIL